MEDVRSDTDWKLKVALAFDAIGSTTVVVASEVVVGIAVVDYRVLRCAVAARRTAAEHRELVTETA